MRVVWRKAWRRLHNEELHALYSSSDVIGVIKSRRLRWAEHVARMGRGNMHTGLWWGKLRKEDHLEGSDVGGRIIMKMIFDKWDGDMDWIDMAQERDRWRAVVNEVMNLLIL